MQATLQIYGDEQYKEWIIQHARNQIIATIAKATYHSMWGTQINGELIPIKEVIPGNFLTVDRSETGMTMMEDVLVQL